MNHSGLDCVQVTGAEHVSVMIKGLPRIDSVMSYKTPACSDHWVLLVLCLFWSENNEEIVDRMCVCARVCEQSLSLLDRLSSSFSKNGWTGGGWVEQRRAKWSLIAETRDGSLGPRYPITSCFKLGWTGPHTQVTKPQHHVMHRVPPKWFLLVSASGLVHPIQV